MRSRIPVALALLLLFSGCTTQTLPDQPEERAAPKATLTEGRLTGHVVTEEQIPIAEAVVAIQGTSLETKTASNGSFELIAVPEGLQFLVIYATGYEQVVLRVTILAGQTTTANAQLTSAFEQVEAYTRALNVRAHVNLMHEYVTYTLAHRGPYTNDTRLNEATCESCMFVIYPDPDPVAVLSEASWAPSGNPAINQDIVVYYHKNWTSDDLGPTVATAGMSNGGSRTWTDTHLERVQGVTKLLVHVHGAGDSISFQQTVDVWTSFAYHEPFDDDYTALSDEEFDP